MDKFIKPLLDSGVATIAAGIITGIAILNLVTFVVTDIMDRLLNSDSTTGSGLEDYVTQIVVAAVLVLVAGYWFGRRLKK